MSASHAQFHLHACAVPSLWPLLGQAPPYAAYCPRPLLHPHAHGPTKGTHVITGRAAGHTLLPCPGRRVPLYIGVCFFGATGLQSPRSSGQSQG
eukprot:6622051-Lingulodinium_polyedra.AAC.2